MIECMTILFVTSLTVPTLCHINIYICVYVCVCVTYVHQLDQTISDLKSDFIQISDPS